MRRPLGLFGNGQEKPIGAGGKDGEALEYPQSQQHATESPDPEEARFAPSPIPLILLGTMLMGATCIGGGGGAVYRNDKAAAPVGGTAEALARERNTCAIDSISAANKFGKPALSVIVKIKSGKSPSSANERYDGVGMDVTFEDAPASHNLLSGLVVANKTHAGEPSGRLLSGGPENSPDNTTNTATVVEPVLTNDESTYEVSRQNAVEAHVTGPLVTDTHFIKGALVSCGTFTYRPGSQPVVN